MAKAKLKRGPMIVGILAILGLAFFGIKKANDSGKLSALQNSIPKITSTKKVKVAIVTWGGFMGGPLYNNGFVSNAESQFKKLGYDVEFVVNDDPSKSLEMWKKGDIDIHWWTVDAFPFISSEYATEQPTVFMQSDWSRGGDAIIGSTGIKNVGDLKGKTIAVAPKTPSYTFLIKTLEANNLTLSDVNVIEVPTAIAAAEKFKSKTVNAAVVWSPDDQSCISSVRGSTIITSTKQATNIIADVFFAKKKFIDKNPELIKALVEGWMIGNADINSSPDAKKKATELMSSGMNQDYGFCETAMNNVRFATFGDNKNFFGVNNSFTGITGENIYNTMGDIYTKAGQLQGYPTWRESMYNNHFRVITLDGEQHAAEKAVSFSNTKTGVEFANKSVSINFVSGSATLTDEAKSVIDETIASTILEFGGAKVRIEGNTDNVGNEKMNVTLSKIRAQAVVTYLVDNYGFDKSRFIVIGNGSSNPTGDNSTEEGRAQNRRTEVVLMK